MKKTLMLFVFLIGALIIVSAIIYVHNRFSNSNSSQSQAISVPASSDVQITTVTPGQGDVAAIGDTVSVNYTGMFVDGKTFDSNTDPSFNHVQPFQFTIGANQVIPGWDKGVLGMKVGEKRHLVVPPSLGYGPNDYGPIPGNSTLVFDVELLSVTHNK